MNLFISVEAQDEADKFEKRHYEAICRIVNKFLDGDTSMDETPIIVVNTTPTLEMQQIIQYLQKPENMQLMFGLMTSLC